ncbi:L,D-transpeptidase family protein [Cochlodiniinecator piscidefendens]|uniref:L,D-transpeptidase family protein n=1 Tax=Cochlodiniinecator piscidefendens TaxID=2715756 RepID=UPI001409CC36|nr:L,D-transpeptidase family protein [Cochlodiniinecator piscidefendens]
MRIAKVVPTRSFFTLKAVALATSLIFSHTPVVAQVTAFKQAVAEAISGDDALASFYRARDFEPIWTNGNGQSRQRLRAFLRALENSGDHGLPMGRYSPDEIRADLRDADNARERGALEVELSRQYLQFSRDLQTGIIENPRRIDSGIVRQIPRRDRVELLETIATRSPNGVFRALAPRTPEYTRLMAEKVRMERLLGQGGWGPEVSSNALEPGQSGAGVVSLRNRLIAMGYLRRDATQTYDGAIQTAVQAFQVDHGLTSDGVAGRGTITEINRSVEDRLQSVIVAMERERWLNRDRGSRHILVNITDFTARIIDNGEVTFQTRSVVGANDSDRRTPEFSDVMEHIVINPTWNVPRSITTNEYLPQMQRNPNAAGHLQLIDSRGRVVNRANVDFSQYTARTFPYAMRQPPSPRNALGRVKFIFPNQYNIYLHDTPAQNLFSREVRTFSHGCVRLDDPYDFAYALLAAQESDPRGFFHRSLDSNRETFVPLETQVPVHLIYRTAFTQARGRINFRRDAYGRDARVWNALRDAGVVIRSIRS